MIKILFLVKKIKRCKIIAIIHDLDSLRFNKDKNEVSKEINILNSFDYIISHNKYMTKWLVENGCNTQIINLELFDYILEDNIYNNIRQTDIIFAGNLDPAKSKFIYNMIGDESISYTINLYGPNFNGIIKNDNLKYMGSYPPDILIENLEGKYGLIWDGESNEECSGIIRGIIILINYLCILQLGCQ